MATIENGTLYKNYSELSVHEKINVKAYEERSNEIKSFRKKRYLDSYVINRGYPEYLYMDLINRFYLHPRNSGRTQRFSKSKLITI